jgi:hypothetical protein
MTMDFTQLLRMTKCQSDLTLHSERMSQKSGCAASISCRSVLMDNPQMVSLRHCKQHSQTSLL